LINNVGVNFFGVNIPPINRTILQYSLSYFPQINIKEFNNSSITIGSPLGIGVYIERGGDFDIFTHFNYEIPLVLDYNIGLTSKESLKKIGCYFGFGFSYNHYSFKEETTYSFTGASYGLLYRAGIKLKKQKGFFSNHINSIGLYYLEGMELNKLKTVGLSFFLGL